MRYTGGVGLKVAGDGPSKERLVNNLRMAIPNIGINARRGEGVLEAALKCATIYKPLLEEIPDLDAVLCRPSKCVSGRLPQLVFSRRGAFGACRSRDAP
eukprot:Skav236371  [mRNA]  locus=scaffold1770:323042:324784:- [translate_table: standard]